MPPMTMTTRAKPRAHEQDVTCAGGSLDGWRVRVERGTPSFIAPKSLAVSATPELYRSVQIAAPDAAGMPMRIEVYATADQSPAEVLRRLELGYSARTFDRQQREAT
jgi:hypothetical protein